MQSDGAKDEWNKMEQNRDGAMTFSNGVIRRIFIVVIVFLSLFNIILLSLLHRNALQNKVGTKNELSQCQHILETLCYYVY